MNWVVEFLILVALLQYLAITGFGATFWIALFFIWKICGCLFFGFLKAIMIAIKNDIKAIMENSGVNQK